MSITLFTRNFPKPSSEASGAFYTFVKSLRYPLGSLFHFEQRVPSWALRVMRRSSKTETVYKSYFHVQGPQVCLTWYSVTLGLMKHKAVRVQWRLPRTACWRRCCVSPASPPRGGTDFICVAHRHPLPASSLSAEDLMILGLWRPPRQSRRGAASSVGSAWS